MKRDYYEILVKLIGSSTRKESPDERELDFTGEESFSF